MGNYIKGEHECFDCGYVFRWEGVLRIQSFVVREKPEVDADVCAIGNDDGKVKYEVVGRCPNCKVMNKFHYERG